MSVIAGMVQTEGPLRADGGPRALLEAIRAYPGDGFDAWDDERAMLACRLLRITPESVRERQPYRDGSSGITIVADAIIDNRVQLFDMLQVERERRSGMTDSELIVLAYRKWGMEAPRYLIGDFAFVLWDADNRQLFGARDLLGSRTLYYRSEPDRFTFCSVIEPLFSLPGMRKKLCEERFAEYLAIPTLLDAVDPHTTYYESIRQLPPGHAFRWSDGKLAVRRYGSVVPENRIVLGSDGEYVEAFRDIYREAVRARLRTVRPVGVTLSGGLDSGSVSALAARLLAQEGRSLQAYSYVPEPDFVDWTPRSVQADESPAIRTVIDYIGNIRGSFLDFAGRSSYTEIDEWIDRIEGPYKNFENAFWIKGIHEEASRQGVGVLLTGARGNYSVSWGSTVAYYGMLLKKLRWLRLYREMTLCGKQLGTSRKRIARAVKRQAFPDKGGDFAPDVPPIIAPSFGSRTGVFEKLADFDVGLKPAEYDLMKDRDNYFNNLSVLGMQGTIAAKASYRLGIWERDATSDARLIRFCLAIPVEQYVKDGFGRALIRRATEGLLPDSVRLNQRTRGIQGMDWVHRIRPQWPAIREELDRLCRDERAARYLDVEQVKQSMSRTRSGVKPEQADDPNLKVLMRALIAYRFLQRLE
ncbi:asparagine synthase-related protein [Paenibacillus thailandensis]|uniref:asparagine synthase (glutamine-hydrolyzing) n=1 Tax=Paenibacillus thailandensis TaxID=393250 RepID=A0ABW5QY48_9BACL